MNWYVAALCLIAYVLGVMSHSAMIWFVLRRVRLMVLYPKSKGDGDA